MYCIICLRKIWQKFQMSDVENIMNLKFLYVRNDYKKRDITIASNLVKEGDKTVIKFGWAFRHKKDKFIKKEGRDRAVEAGRAKSGASRRALTRGGDPLRQGSRSSKKDG